MSECRFSPIKTNIGNHTITLVVMPHAEGGCSGTASWLTKTMGTVLVCFSLDTQPGGTTKLTVRPSKGKKFNQDLKAVLLELQ